MLAIKISSQCKSSKQIFYTNIISPLDDTRDLSSAVF